jgi:hypothetical protein
VSEEKIEDRDWENWPKILHGFIPTHEIEANNCKYWLRDMREITTQNTMERRGILWIGREASTLKRETERSERGEEYPEYLRRREISTIRFVKKNRYKTK